MEGGIEIRARSEYCDGVPASPIGLPDVGCYLPSLHGRRCWRIVVLQASACCVDSIDMSTLHSTIIERPQTAAEEKEVRPGRTLRGFRLVRSRRVLWVLAAVWVLNGFDLGFTMVAHAAGHFTELNPIAADLLTQPWYYLTIFKFVCLAVGTIILLILARHKVAELGSWLLLAAYVFVAARWYDYFNGMLDDPLLALLWR